MDFSPVLYQRNASVLELKANKDKVMGFLTDGLWKKRLKDLSGREALLLKPLRIIMLSVKGFLEDKCSLRASALTFYSLLAIVPVLAMAFGIAKGFGLRQRLRVQLMTVLSGQEDILTRAIDFADRLLESASGGAVAGIGVIVLFWSVIKVLGQIEGSFNDIWEVRTERPFARRFSNYFSIMLISPVVIIVSGSLTIFISTQITYIAKELGVIGVLGPVVFLTLRVLPYALMWLLLAFVYITIPNTKVRFRPGMAGAVVAGTIYQVVQWAYIFFQIGISKYNAIYGSFAALPLFLVWLNLSWLIVLFGAELSYAFQNVEDYDLDPMARHTSASIRKWASLLIAHLVVKNFVRGRGPIEAEDISKRLGLPPRLARELLTELVEAGVLNENGDPYTRRLHYQPALATDTITVGSVLYALDSRGTEELPLPESPEAGELTEALRAFHETVLASPANRRLRDI